MMEGTAFPTRGGACVLREDHLELVREGWQKGLSLAVFGKNNSRFRLSQWLAAFGGFAAAGLSLLLDNYLLLVFFAGIGIYYLYQLWQTRDISFDTRIAYSRIHGIDYQAAVEGASRPHFVLHFTDQKGKLRRRIITLAAAGSGGREAAQTAQYLFREKGLTVNILREQQTG